MIRDLHTTQHEAAHVVVGVALGLRLRKAVVGKAPRPNWSAPGYAWFTNHGSDYAHAIMYAAGVAWERAMHNGASPADAQLCLELVKSEDELKTCVRVAQVMLAGLGRAHRAVTKALLEQDLNSKHIAAIARGERLEFEE